MDGGAIPALPLGKFTDDPLTSYTLPSVWYHDREIHEMERTRVFHRGWNFVCHRNEVANPGDYAAMDICGESVAVVRGRDGELRGFFNVCQHRGHKLLTGRGSLRASIVCPYHAWSYGLDGELRAARGSDKMPGFDKSEFCLNRVRIEEYGGFVFANADAGAKPLSEQMPGLDAAMAEWYPDLDNLEFHSRTDFEIAANWKVVVENAIEGYHFDLSGECHRSFSETMNRKKGNAVTNHEGWISFFIGPGESTNTAYPFPREGGGQTDHYAAFVVFPNLVFYTLPYANFVSAFLTVPTGPETSRLESYMYVPRGAGIDETTEQAIEFFNKRLSPEDIELNVGVQAGLRSRGYEQGRFIVDMDDTLRSEHTVHYFQKMVVDAVSA